MLHARCKADVLKTLIDATSTLVDEVKVHVTPEGLSLKAVDPAHVAMVELTLRAAAFQEYKADSMDMGVDLEKFKEVLKLASGDDEVELDFDATGHRLVMRIGNVTRKMSLVDTSAINDPKVPKLDLAAHITLNPSELERGIRASEAIADHVVLTADKDGFELLAEGDTDQVHLRLDKSMLAELRTNEKVKSLFSLDYFANMVKAAKGSSGIHINLGNDYPVKIEFDLAGGNGHVTYLLAPRIES
jgi:proliferating cell nuclear antigen